MLRCYLGKIKSANISRINFGFSEAKLVDVLVNKIEADLFSPRVFGN